MVSLETVTGPVELMLLLYNYIVSSFLYVHLNLSVIEDYNLYSSRASAFKYIEPF